MPFCVLALQDVHVGKEDGDYDSCEAINCIKFKPIGDYPQLYKGGGVSCLTYEPLKLRNCSGLVWSLHYHSPGSSENRCHTAIIGHGRHFPATKSTYSSVATAAMAKMKTKEANQHYFAVIYDYVPDILEKRGQHRTEHLALANQMVDEGKMLMGGAWGSPIDGALMLFCVHDVGEVHAFIEKDPYVRNALVTKVDIRPYAVVVGALVRS